MCNLLFRCVLDGYGLIWVDHVLNALQMKVSFLIVQKGRHHSVILSMITSESFWFILSPRMPLTRAFSRESLHSPKQESLMQANLFLKYVTDCDISLMTDPNKVLCISLRKSHHFATQRQRHYRHFSVIVRPRVLVRPQESNLRPRAPQSSALTTELILPQSNENDVSLFHVRCR